MPQTAIAVYIFFKVNKRFERNLVMYSAKEEKNSVDEGEMNQWFASFSSLAFLQPSQEQN